MLDTYSFSDIYSVISISGFPAYTLNGQGIGEINFDYANDNTTHDVAADGRVMPSKIKADNGSIAITMQQTSPLHKWFTEWFNFLKFSKTENWAKTQIMISSPAGMFDTIIATGVSPVKRAGRSYQAQGQMVTWNLLATRIEEF